MKQYFKDYKSKMELSKQSPVNFQPETLNSDSKGIFVKKKVQTENVGSVKEEISSGFKFNFNDPSDLSQVTSKVNSIDLK